MATELTALVREAFPCARCVSELASLGGIEVSGHHCLTTVTAQAVVGFLFHRRPPGDRRSRRIHRQGDNGYRSNGMTADWFAKRSQGVGIGHFVRPNSDSL
jgi:hypothetical protein